MGSVQSFLLTWTGMTALMMAPSVTPFIVSFARRVRGRPPAIGLLVAAYLLVWTIFGVAVYLAMAAISLPWPAVVAAGVAIAFVGAYAFTPLMRMGQARCIAMCRRSDPLESGAFRAALGEGLTYGVGCVACSAGVMLALVVLGMSNVLLMVAGSALILLYKVAGPWPRRFDAGLSFALVLGGIWLIT